MSLRGKKLGLLLSSRPEAESFGQALKLAEAGLRKGVDTYLYCIDEAVHGLEDPRLQELKRRGLKLYACAFGAHRHHVAIGDQAIFAGLTVVSDLIAGTDRFLAFNG
jgi:hypothetical protein